MNTVTSSTISNPLLPQTSNVATTQQTTSDAAGNSSVSNNIFGPAVTVDLSDSAKAFLASQTSPSSPVNDNAAPHPDAAAITNGNDSDTNTAAAPPPPPPAPTGGGANLSALETADATIELQKIADQVGIVDANQIVDKQGNVDQIALQNDLAQIRQQIALREGKA